MRARAAESLRIGRLMPQHWARTAAKGVAPGAAGKGSCGTVEREVCELSDLQPISIQNELGLVLGGERREIIPR